MKVAICYFGMTGYSDGKEGDGSRIKENAILKNNLEKVIKPNNADVFIHSWSKHSKDMLIEYYQPKQYIFEAIKSTDDLVTTKKLKVPVSRALKNLVRHGKYLSTEDLNSFYRASSRWLSNSKAIELALSSSITYDLILTMRLDLIFNRTFLLPNNIRHDELLVSHWNDAYLKGTREYSNFENHSYKKKGFLDLWFAGKVQTMTKFKEIFSERYEYSISPHLSSYEHCLKSKITPRFELYRGIDYELYRRQVLKASR